MAYKLEYVDSADETDTVFEHFGVKVFVDPKSLAYLDGTELDYGKEGLNEGFKFNKNDGRSMLDPIDYVIFEGLSEKRKVDKIVFDVAIVYPIEYIEFLEQFGSGSRFSRCVKGCFSLFELQGLVGFDLGQ